jgi:hypothetical protein
LHTSRLPGVDHDVEKNARAIAEPARVNTTWVMACARPSTTPDIGARVRNDDGHLTIITNAKFADLTITNLSRSFGAQAK